MNIDKNLLILPDVSVEENQPMDSVHVKEEEVKDLRKREVKKLSHYEVHVCLPCKRLFRSFDTLLKHQQDS